MSTTKTTTPERIDWQNIRGDGGTRPCPPGRLTQLKDEFRQLCTDAGESVNDRRELSDDIRFCRWDGQSRDGKKHSAARGDRPAFPFEGASDARIRLADNAVNEQVIILAAALLRSQIGFRGTESNDDAFAGSMNTLWHYVRENALGAEWFTEWTKAAQWRQGDSPAVSFMQVYWKQEYELSATETNPSDIHIRVAEMFATQNIDLAADPAALLDLQDLLANPSRRDELAGLLTALWPDMPPKRTRIVARELQENQTATFPYPRLSEDRLAIKARRLFEDIFIPENTPTDIQRARVIYIREWKTEVELREAEARGVYLPGFVDEVLKHEGETAWSHLSHYTIEGDYSEAPVSREWDRNRRRGQYEIITAFFKAVNDDGYPGIYTLDFHFNVEEPGTPLELLDYKTGQYPFIPLQREILTDNLWDTRGISELTATDQQALKLLHDSFMDHAQLCTVPPLEVPASRPNLNLVIGPLKRIKVQRPGEIRFMTMAQYPQTNTQVQDAIVRMHNRYFGRFTGPEGNPPDLVRLYNEYLIGFFLFEVGRVVKMGMQLVQQFISPETLARITGEDNLPIARTPEDIQGMFDVTLSFEAGMLNFDYLKAMGEMISQYVLAWDSLSVVQRDELVTWYLSALSPTLAKRITRPVKQAEASEIEDEENNFTQIAAGIEPPMQTEGQNFALRLQVEEDIVRRNPEAFTGMTPASQKIYLARVQHLRGMVEQEQNAIIGRTMARPALAPEPGSPTPVAAP